MSSDPIHFCLAQTSNRDLLSSDNIYVKSWPVDATTYRSMIHFPAGTYSSGTLNVKSRVDDTDSSLDVTVDFFGKSQILCHFIRGCERNDMIANK